MKTSELSLGVNNQNSSWTKYQVSCSWISDIGCDCSTHPKIKEECAPWDHACQKMKSVPVHLIYLKFYEELEFQVQTKSKTDVLYFD